MNQAKLQHALQIWGQKNLGECLKITGEVGEPYVVKLFLQTLPATLSQPVSENNNVNNSIEMVQLL